MRSSGFNRPRIWHLHWRHFQIRPSLRYLWAECREAGTSRLRPGIVEGAGGFTHVRGNCLFFHTACAIPRVSNYVQLTHDGLQKSLIGTDGSSSI